MTMTPPEHEGRGLATWLDTPGSEPPIELDEDVVEAVLALRPDLAPAPRVAIDDILGAVREGPLATNTAPANDRAAPSPEPRAEVVPLRPSPRFASVGGWSGIGLIAAAAATFLLVALPAMQADRSSERLAESPAAPAATAPPPLAAPPAVPSPPPPPPVERAAARPQAAPPPAEPAAYDMEGGAALKERDLIPELADGVATDAPASGWREQVGSADAERVQAHLDAAAQADDPRQAGDLAALGIAPPAAAAHAAAWAASTYYLAAGDRTAAAAAALKGLNVAGPSPDRSRLAARYGDLVRDTNPAEAERWYQEAAR